MEHLSEALSKSMIKKLKKRDTNIYYLVIPYNDIFDEIYDVYHSNKSIWISNSAIDAIIVNKEVIISLMEKYSNDDDIMIFEISPDKYYNIDEFAKAFENDEITLNKNSKDIKLIFGKYTSF